MKHENDQRHLKAVAFLDCIHFIVKKKAGTLAFDIVQCFESLLIVLEYISPWNGSFNRIFGAGHAYAHHRYHRSLAIIEFRAIQNELKVVTSFVVFS